MQFIQVTGFTTIYIFYIKNNEGKMLKITNLYKQIMEKVTNDSAASSSVFSIELRSCHIKMNCARKP